VFIPSGFLDFTQPVESNAVIYQYVPYTFPLQATGSTDFIYYFAEGVPIGFTFTLDPTGTFATLSGNSPINRSATVTLYAKTAFIPATRRTFTLNTVVPFVINQQIGAAAYTAILREHVEADAAQNARDTKVFPEVNPLAGPFMAPRAPDVTTDSNCPKCEPPTGPPLVPPTQAVGYTEAPNSPTPNTGVVTTLAGSGSPAFADGTGSEASFNLPRGVGVDLDGTIIVADSSNNRIRRITPGGVVTTIAGSGAVGNTDGIGTEATFSNPYSVIVRPDGTIVVADTGNSRIRLISPGGAVTTLAGSTAGYLDGTGTSARFNFPSSVGVLSNGVIVVGDNRNHRIRLVTPEGVVTTLAGGTAGYLDGIGTAARFTNPYGVAVLPNGVIAVTGNARVRLVTPAGVVSTLAGSTFGFADGTGSAAKFIGPRSIALLPSSSLIAVADSDNNRIRLVSPTGIVTTLAGSLGGADDGIGTAASFSRPDGVAVVPSSGAILVADTFNNRIRLISGAF
jgi:sugar lactone lactonase YvrE